MKSNKCSVYRLTSLAFIAAVSVSPIVFAQEDYSKKEGFHITLPREGANRVATDVHITFYGPPTGIVAPGWTSQSVSGNVLNLWGGSISPGGHFDLTALIKQARKPGDPIIESITWSDSGREVDGGFLTYDAKDMMGRKYLNGFNNFEYFDFSNPDAAEFVFNNFTTTDTALKYTLTDFSLYLTKEDSTIIPLLSISSLDVLPGENLRFPIGKVQSGWVATASIGPLTVFDTINGTTDTYTTPQRYSQSVPVPDSGSTFGLLCFGSAVLLSMLGWNRRNGAEAIDRLV